MAFDEALAQRIRRILTDRRRIEEKKMFGGVAFMPGGKMFCGTVGDDLMVRVGPSRYEECLPLAHVRPMDFTGKPMRGYVFVGHQGCRTAKTLARWIDRGLELISGAQDAALSKPRQAKPGRRAKASTSAYAEVFQELKQLVRARAGFLDVQSDTETEYILTGPMMPRRRKELWFGGVRMGRACVSLHLMPVYMFPDLLEEASASLRARMQGKSCFNFKRVEPELFAELDGLIASCIKRLRAEGILQASAPTLQRPLHPMDAAVGAALEERGLMAAYRNRPPYQRNDYLGWINRAKRDETKAKRVQQMLNELERGDLYMKMAWRQPSRTR
jgi:hypothetical protein